MKYPNPRRVDRKLSDAWRKIEGANSDPYVLTQTLLPIIEDLWYAIAALADEIKQMHGDV